LYHTHSGSGCYDYANCSENIDASNCSTCGDLVCDTPADPCLSGKVTTACIYIGDSRYTPDVNNIMSYAPPSCLTHFSNGQIERLHDMITNASVLQNVWSPINISGSSSLCNSSSSYFIDAPPSGETISWSTSNNITRLSSQGANPCTFNAVSSNIVGNGRITAVITINGNTFTIDKDIWVGKPQLYTYDENGNETTSGKVVTVSAGTAVTFEAYCYDSTATLDWDVTPSTANYSISGNSCTVMATTEFISIVAKANNECGEYMMLNTLSGTSGGGFPLNVNVYPNPASITINIEMLSIAKLSQDEIYNKIQLYDNLMNLKKQFKVKGNYSTIDVSNLKRGFYYLRLKSNKNVYTKQILIEK